MNLEYIEISGRGNKIGKLVSALENLPDGTIEGISEYGHVRATINNSEGHDVINVASRHHSPNYMEVTIPRESTSSMVTDGSSVSFLYQKIMYVIFPVRSSRFS